MICAKNQKLNNNNRFCTCTYFSRKFEIPHSWWSRIDSSKRFYTYVNKLTSTGFVNLLCIVDGDQCQQHAKYNVVIRSKMVKYFKCFFEWLTHISNNFYFLWVLFLHFPMIEARKNCSIFFSPLFSKCVFFFFLQKAEQSADLLTYKSSKYLI